MNKLDQDYQQLLMDIMANGVEKEDRTGTGTISVFGRQIRHNMQDGFPLLTTKKMAVKSIMTELKWFLKGDTNIKYLVDNGCNIWNGDAYKAYLAKETMPGIPPHDHVLSYTDFVEKMKTDDSFARANGELGPIYGHQWRSWTVKEDDSYGGEYVWVDQIKNLINDLKTNPDSRRLMVSAWNPGDQPEMALPPCHYGFQVYTRPSTREEKITNPGKYRVVSLMWNQRSVDTFLGLPFNIASYGMLLELIAKECDMIPGELIGNLGDVHLYKNHVKQAKEQLTRSSYGLPALTKLEGDILKGEFDYTIEYYESWPKIEAPLSN